jgi:hypothetical protein
MCRHVEAHHQSPPPSPPKEGESRPEAQPGPLSASGGTIVEPEVRELLAKQAITEVIYRYCRGLDRMDRALADTVWHPGGTADYGPMFAGTGAGFLDWVWQSHTGFEAHSHQITNILITVASEGDRAASESYVTVALRLPPNAGRVFDVVGRGRYLDRWSQRGGVWAIDHRRYVHDIQALYEAHPSPGMETSGPTGRRDASDPSHELFPVGG